RDGNNVLDARHELDAALNRMRDDLMSDGDGNPARTRKGRDGVLHELANHLVLTFRRITELNLDGNLIAVDAHVLHRLAGDEVLPGIGIDHALEGRHNVSVGQRHRKLREKRAYQMT